MQLSIEIGGRCSVNEISLNEVTFFRKPVGGELCLFLLILYILAIYMGEYENF